MDMTARRSFLAALGAVTTAGCLPLALGAAAGMPPVDPRINLGLVRKDDTVYKEYLQGVVHAP